jgi:hypothetical protein
VVTTMCAPPSDALPTPPPHTMYATTHSKHTAKLPHRANVACKSDDTENLRDASTCVHLYTHT